MIDMESKIIEQLKEITALATVDVFQGNIEDAMLTSMKLSAALVIYSGARTKEDVGNDSLKARVTIHYTVFVIGKNLKGAKTVSANVRALLDEIREKLIGIQHEGRTLLWEEETLNQITKTGICIYSQHYRYEDYIIASLKEV
ncbi:MAG: hypothetical protein L7F77_09235 [Candidatus Magnetominusculus sp. LBB02]|nr:hypothetical protein [Candidatus Magnetominusculus sp. LBB02]